MACWRERRETIQTARKHLEETVTLDPNNPNSRVNLGLVLEELKDPAGAKIQLEKALALGRDDPQIHFELSKVLRTLGKTAAAQGQLALFQQRLKQESNRALAVSKAAEAAEAVKAGDNQKAAGLYRQACAAKLAERPAGLRVGARSGQSGRPGG